MDTYFIVLSAFLFAGNYAFSDVLICALKSKAVVWVEAEDAEDIKTQPGIAIDTRKAQQSSAGIVLGVRGSQSPPVRWEFSLTSPVSNPVFCLRYACLSDVPFELQLNDTPLGQIVLPGTDGWGYQMDQWRWAVVSLPDTLAEGSHTFSLRPLDPSHVNLDCWLVAGRSSVPLAAAVSVPLQPVSERPKRVRLSTWKEPSGQISEPFILGVGQIDRRGWGGYSPNERMYFHEPLPLLFERTLALDDIDQRRRLEWIFTGPRMGFTIVLEGQSVKFHCSYYDSYGFNVSAPQPSRHPELLYHTHAFTVDQRPAAITVSIDHTLTLRLFLNGDQVLDIMMLEDIRRHQIRTQGQGPIAARMLAPKPVTASVKVCPDQEYQTMLGWGGIGIPTAYQELSPQGKRRWWEWVNTYNLLIQREYPIGGVLNEAMDNWDTIEYAKAHYYGDNFPNGEISDFHYNTLIQELGGFVMFEFWDFPVWVGDDEDRYADAMVEYCKIAQARTGRPPRIVGVQNEVYMSEDRVNRFVPALRKALDEAGFSAVKIHMANATSIQDGLDRAARFTENPNVWSAIDYGAVNMYDYQNHFRDPDRFDAIMKQWHLKVKDRPFISPELSINDNRYQVDSYRVALTMGQLYHKNLTITDAIMIGYCWTLLNVEQNSYGATRSLFVSTPEAGFMPTPSSNQLRIFGAYSRRIKEGMIRVYAVSDQDDLLVTAFKGDNDLATLVALNRSAKPMKLNINWPGAKWRHIESVTPYAPNLVRPVSKHQAVIVEPGGVITLTNVPLNTLPDDLYDRIE